MEQPELTYTVGRNVNWYDHSGKRPGIHYSEILFINEEEQASNTSTNADGPKYVMLCERSLKQTNTDNMITFIRSFKTDKTNL